MNKRFQFPAGTELNLDFKNGNLGGEAGITQPPARKAPTEYFPDGQGLLARAPPWSVGQSRCADGMRSDNCLFGISITDQSRPGVNVETLTLVNHSCSHARCAKARMFTYPDSACCITFNSPC